MPFDNLQNWTCLQSAVGLGGDSDNKSTEQARRNQKKPMQEMQETQLWADIM